MSKQALDVHQMQRLQEMGLELKETMMYWARRVDNNPRAATHYGKWILTKGNNAQTVGLMHWEFIPAYTLQDVLDALPHSIGGDEEVGCWLQIEQMDRKFDDWRVSYVSVCQDEYLRYSQSPNLIDAAYEMLVWCVEQGYVEANKNK